MLDALKQNLASLLALAFIIATYVTFFFRMQPLLRKRKEGEAAPKGIGVELAFLSVIAVAYFVALILTQAHGHHF